MTIGAKLVAGLRALARALNARVGPSLFALLAGLAAAAGAHALEPVRLSGCAAIELGPRELEVALVDDGVDPPGVGASVDTLLRLAGRPASADGMNFGHADRVLLGFSVVGGGCAATTYLELRNLFTNRVRLHRQTPMGTWVDESPPPGGEANAPARLRQALLPLRLEPGEPTRFVVEVGGGPAPVILAPRLVAGAAPFVEASARSALSGIVAGAIFSIAAYCALLGAVTRFIGLVSFSLSALAMGALYAMLAGTFDPLLMSVFDGAGAASRVERINASLVFTASLFHWIFIRRLLGGPTAGTMRDRWIPALLALWGASMVALPLVEHPWLPRISVAIAIGAVAMIVRELVVAWRVRHPLAPLIAAAFGTLAIPVLAFVALVEGLTPAWPSLLNLLGLGMLSESIMLAMAVGAQVRSLRGRHRRLAERTHELTMLSQLDPLTGLGNRRAYDLGVSDELERCMRRGRVASLLVIDIDHFKKVNDTFGHEFGDAVIRSLGVTIANCVRTSDRAFRYGGEEFVVLLPGLGSAMAHEVGERIMREFTNCGPTAPDGTRPFVSVSIGLTQMRPGDDARAMFARADSAMYRAKQNGRCRLEASEEAGASAIAA